MDLEYRYRISKTPRGYDPSLDLYCVEVEKRGHFKPDWAVTNEFYTTADGSGFMNLQVSGVSGFFKVN